MVGVLLLALLGCEESADHLKSFEDTAAPPLTSTGTVPGTTDSLPTTTTPVAEDCFNGIDDDGDGRPDCFDTECEPICDADGDGEDNIAMGGDDCDDTNPDVNPDALELCDGVDNDCDLLIDDADPDLPPAEQSSWYPDLDGDGYGNRDEEARRACAQPPNSSATNDDCNDADDTINPGRDEICSWNEPVDEDCDDLIDDADPDITEEDYLDWFADADGDGFGSGEDIVRACSRPEASALTNDDCDDSDPTVGPPSLWYPDLDRDGHGVGVPFGPDPTCEPPGPGYGPDWRGFDCDDAAPATYPGAEEICEDGVDQDCDGVDAVCITYAGSYLVHDGPGWMTYPPTYTCREACAEIFGGDEASYRCSVDDDTEDPETITDSAWLSEYGAADNCMSGGGGPLPDDAKSCVNYDTAGCQSAYIMDNCGDGSTNHCWVGG